MTYDLEVFKAMIPIYLNGRISPTDRQAFDAAREEFPELEEELQAFAEIQQSYATQTERTPVDSDALFVRIQSNIRQENSGAARPVSIQDFFHRLGRFFSSLYRMPGLSWSLAGAQLAVILALVVILPGKSGYRTLTENPTVNQARVSINVAFKQDAREAEIRVLLRAVGATIVSGPSASGFYRLEIKNGPNVEALVSKLKNADIVRFAEKSLSNLIRPGRNNTAHYGQGGVDRQWHASL